MERLFISMNGFGMRMLLFIAFFYLVQSGSAQDQLPDWALGPFLRPFDVNPIISPDPQTWFFDPMSKQNVAWEASDVFNPGAVVRKNRIYLLYRGEDRSGNAIGKRTSRIGLAKSKNGIEMKRRSRPVMYPDEDPQKEHEWPGGCEDPRIAVTEDGLFVMLYT